MTAPEEWENELDAKERRFVSEYLLDLDPRRAAIAAGYSESMASSKAYQWVSNSKTKPHVFAAVQNAMSARSKRTEITSDRVLKELAKIGFADIRKAVRWESALVTEEDNPDGGDIAIIKRVVTNQVQLVSSDNIDDETAAAISEISQNASGGVKIKLHDKRAALVDIGRHLGMFTEKLNVNLNMSELSDDQLVESIRKLDAAIKPFLASKAASEAGGGD